MSKIKVLDTNESLMKDAQSILDNLMEMQTRVDTQLHSIKSIENEIIDIEREKKEKARLEKQRQKELQLQKEEQERKKIELREEQERKKEEQRVKAEAEKEKAAEEKKAAQEKEVQQEAEKKKTKEQSKVAEKQKTKESVKEQAKVPTSKKEDRRQKEQKAKKHQEERPRERRGRKAVIRERVFALSEDDLSPRHSRRKQKQEKKSVKPVMEAKKIEKAVITEETVSVKLLSEKIGQPVSELLKKLLLLGMTCNINSQVDFDTAHLIAEEFGVELDQKVEKTAEDILVEETEEKPENLEKRPPVVTIMGHVDHGKTSLLDKIRASQVTEGEAGGITQHIGAYQVDKNNEKITFIDTPGHEAFTAMRARGAQVTDIVIIVVAADDGIMPQTVEAINHAKSADVPIIVAVNKMDLPTADPQRVMQALTEYELLPEEWGGDTIVAEVSAKTGDGIDKLLEMILLVAEMQELQANPDRLAKGTIVEAQLDKGRGPVATVLVEAGTLRVGDTIIAGTAYGRVRAMIDDHGQAVDEAMPAQPVEVIGFSEVPVAGDVMHAASSDNRLTRQVAEERRDREKAEMLKKVSQVSLDDLFDQIEQGQIKDLNLVIKADMQGSVEAVKQSLEKLSNEEVRVSTIHSGVGGITEADVMLAAAGNAIIIGFNVRANAMAVTAAEHEKVDIRLYRVIYKAIEDISNAMKGMLDPEFKEVVTGHAEVRQLFKASSVGTIAGCYVTDGVIKRNSDVRLVRDDIVIHEGKLSSLKRFQDDVREVAAGYECGLSLENYNDIKELDIIECFEMQEIERV